jgi:peptide/nickel transport system permease protein
VRPNRDEIGGVMGRFILRRLGFVALTMVVASAIIFAATQVIPGDITSVILGQFATPEAKQNLRVELGLDRPLVVQYLDWLVGFVKGDWGESINSHVPIREIVFQRLGNSLTLAVAGFAMFVPLGILAGIAAALKKNSWVDNTISIGALVFIGLPEFVSGIVLIYVFSFKLGLLPAQSPIDLSLGFWSQWQMLVLPAVTISLTNLAYVTRMTRSSTVQVLETDYVRTAYLKGLSRRTVIGRHVLRNSLLPTVTIIALCIGWLVGGLIVTESVFSYPGIGRLLLFGIERRDIPLIQAVSMLIVVVVGIANLVADVLYAWLNPRISYK